MDKSGKSNGGFRFLGVDSNGSQGNLQPSFGFNSNIAKNNTLTEKKQTLVASTLDKGIDIEKKIKDEADNVLKQYQVPSAEHLIQNEDEMDIEDDDYFDIDIDESTNLPIRKLNYEGNSESLLSKGEHIKFAVSNKTEQGMLFVTPSDEVKSTDKKVMKDKTELFPFDLLPQIDQSSEYKQFLNKLYKEFEPLLENKKYKYYLKSEDDEYMQIGVMATIQKERKEREIFLRKLMSFILKNLQDLIKDKMKQDFGTFNDQWIVNYEEIINVLYLLNALHFDNEDETIVLFQQWIERIDIQPDDELLESVFKESDKPYNNFTFWSVYVKKLLMRGSFNNLVEDLKACQFEELEKEDIEIFKLIEDFINLISSYNSIQFSYDIESFLKWKRIAVELRETSNHINTEYVMIHSEILELLNILSGSSKTIEENSSTWYECFIAHFLYQMPSKKLIPGYIKKSLESDIYDKPISGIDSWDSICVDLFNGKFLTVIASIESLDKSIGTFIAILMESSSLLDSYVKDIPKENLINRTETVNGISNNIDRMIEDLALAYLNNQDLFAIGVGILINIGNDKNREILSELLPSYEIKDSDDFEWVLSICSKLKLTKTMRTIQQIQGEKFYDKKLIPNALNCFAEARSSEKIVSTVWKLFEHTLINKGLDKELYIQLFESDMCDNNAILRQSLSPLYILVQVVKNDNINNEVWFKRLISLFDFKYLPEYYKVGLVKIIFENLNQNVFSLDNLVEIIERLNIYEKNIHKNEDNLQDKSETIYTILTKDESGYPVTLSELLLSVRRGVAMDVSFSFLDESMY